MELVGARCLRGVRARVGRRRQEPGRPRRRLGGRGRRGLAWLRGALGARALGDRIVVTARSGRRPGRPRALARGVRSSAEGRSRNPGRALIEALEPPVARVGEAQLLARAGATAMLDLGRPGGRLAPCGERSGGRAPVAAAIPVAEPLLSGATTSRSTRRRSPSRAARTTSCSRPSAAAVERAREELRSGFGVDLSEIGEIVAVLPRHRGRGRRRWAWAPLEPAGWDHFAHG